VRPETTARTERKLAYFRVLVLLLAWETVFPLRGPLPQMSQRFAIRGPLHIMTKDNVKLGQTGEEWAVKYLKKQGYGIVERNVRTRFGEIDIVASRKRDLYFVEVKTRRGSSFGSSLESLPVYRQKRLARMAEWYFKTHRVSSEICYHLSLLGIDVSGSEPKIELIPDITI